MEMHTFNRADNHSTYFKLFVESLVLKFKPLQIFCFSKETFLEEVQSCFNDEKMKQRCNYCLLLVTKSTNRIDYEVQDYSNAHFKLGKVTILCHPKETIEEAFKANSRFFITVCNEGKLVYSHDGLTNFYVPAPFIPTQSGAKALKHFKYRIPLAEGFLIGAGECLNKEQYSVCVFMLHQVVEQVCIVLIRVFMAYRSEIHNLHKLLRLCSCFSSAPMKLFLSGSPEDERLFDILLKSYSGARYKSNFFVLTDDAWVLYNKTAAFVALAKELCHQKVEELDCGDKVSQEFVVGSEVIHA
jgi:uncharacterized protein